MRYEDLSREQRQFVDVACRGGNVLVDACIGSGKTTAIQALCEMPAMARRNVLYLTYNRLLRVDAQAKIRQRNTYVTNYHSFAYRELRCMGRNPSVTSCIRDYLDSGIRPPSFDVLIIDEYQDIEQELAELLEKIKSSNPAMQIVAVGDMCQKIYDKTRLDAASFIAGFLGGEGKFFRLEFTRCFRLNADMADRLSDVWEKKITGVNPDQEVLHMTFLEAERLLAARDPGDILVLGANGGLRNELQNQLESRFPEKFNKNTVWSKIRDGEGGATEPGPGTAVFTTYDGCKGMERPVCVLTDWTEDYWGTRSRQEMVRYEILRNVFCVAASRGKEKIIFVEGGGGIPLDDRTLRTPFRRNGAWKSVQISSMFDFKFIEDVQRAYGVLDIREIQAPGGIISVQNHDALVDISPCLGTYIEAAYFDGCDIDTYIEEYFDNYPDEIGRLNKAYPGWPLSAKVLYLTSLNTKQERYLTQVDGGLISPDKWTGLPERLAERLPADCEVQTPCVLAFGRPDGSFLFAAKGRLDAVQDGIIYELKFVSALQPQHFLQLAMYMCAREIDTGRLWNVRDNQIYEVRVPDRNRFLSLALAAVTKGEHTRYVPFDASQLEGVGLALKAKPDASRRPGKPGPVDPDTGRESAAGRKDSQDPSPGVKPGMRAVHDKFGPGVVTAVSGSGHGMTVTMDFGDKGTKKLLLSAAAGHLRPVPARAKKPKPRPILDRVRKNKNEGSVSN